MTTAPLYEVRHGEVSASRDDACDRRGAARRNFGASEPAVGISPAAILGLAFWHVEAQCVGSGWSESGSQKQLRAAI
jgi:hypothetical protein